MVSSIKKVNVIEVKDSFKNMVPFKIGHSNAKSETLYPISHKLTSTKYNIVDVAGFGDSGG